MTGDGLLVGAVNTAAFLLSASFLAYVVSIVIPLVRHRPSTLGDPSAFQWHFLVPCLNEELVIEATLAQLRKRFPQAEVWCVDDASTDRTPQIVSRVAALDGRVHVVTRRSPDAQQGKGPALNAGWRALAGSLGAGVDLEGVIVGVVDADGSLDPRCLEHVSGSTFFGDPTVSAVQVMVRVDCGTPEGATTPVGSRLLTRMQDVEFTCVIAAMQMLRRHAGSCGMGGNGQFTRLATLQRVADSYRTPWQSALLEDFELGLHILLTGGRTEYCHGTCVTQQGLPTLAGLLRQRSRWAQGLMQCFRYLWPILRSPLIGTSAALEISYFMLLPWIQLLGGLVYVASMAVLTYAAFALSGGPVHWLGGGAWGVIPLFLLFGLGPLVLWGPIYRRTVAPELSRTKALGLGLVNWPYSYVHYLSTWWAFARVLMSRRDWKKTERLGPAEPDRAALDLSPPAIRTVISPVTPPDAVAARGIGNRDTDVIVRATPSHLVISGRLRRRPVGQRPVEAPDRALLVTGHVRRTRGPEDRSQREAGAHAGQASRLAD